MGNRGAGPFRRTSLALLAAAGVLAGAALAAPATAAEPLGGPDVASYQHPGGTGIEWPVVANSNQRFAIVKATQGTGYTNPYFAADWAGARAAGMIRGAYHFATPQLPISTASAQAQHFIAVTGSTRAQGDLPPMLDLEISGGLAPRELVAWTSTFLATVQALTGRQAIIYSYPAFWYRAMNNTTAFDAYPLWLASYTGTGSPGAIPGGWRSWALWQYTDSAVIPGINTAADRSQFCCTAASLSALADGSDTAILAKYRQLGGPRGFLGLPQGAEYALPTGWAQRYAHGQIMASPSTGAHVLYGPLLARYLAEGGGAGPLGLPTSDPQHPAALASAVDQSFANGELLDTPFTGVQGVYLPGVG